MKRVKEQIKYLALLAICLLSGCSDFLDSYTKVISIKGELALPPF